MKTSSSLHRLLHGIGVAVLALSFAGAGLSDAQAQTKKPNILVLWGDDIGTANVSADSGGVMGYETPIRAKGNQP
jgi:arylsulfatase